MLLQKGTQGREGIDADGDEPDAAFEPGVGLDGRERLIKGTWLLRLNGECCETLFLLQLKFALALRLSGFRGCFFCGALFFSEAPGSLRGPLTGLCLPLDLGQSFCFCGGLSCGHRLEIEDDADGELRGQARVLDGLQLPQGFAALQA